MPIDLSSVSIYPHYHSFDCNTVANEVQLPDGCDQIEIENWHSTNDLYIGQNNQADGQTWDNDYQFVIPAKQAKKILLSRGGARAKKIYIAASTNTIPVNIELVNK